MGWDTLLAVATGGVSIPITKAINDNNKRDNTANSARGALSPMPLPEAPNPADAAAKAQEAVKKRRASVSQTVFTDPLGVGGQADIVRKTLTGQ